jgi:hypothetical protein
LSPHHIGQSERSAEPREDMMVGGVLLSYHWHYF